MFFFVCTRCLEIYVFFHNSQHLTQMVNKLSENGPWSSYLVGQQQSPDLILILLPFTNIRILSFFSFSVRPPSYFLLTTTYLSCQDVFQFLFLIQVSLKVVFRQVRQPVYESKPSHKIKFAVRSFHQFSHSASNVSSAVNVFREDDYNKLVITTMNKISVSTEQIAAIPKQLLDYKLKGRKLWGFQ